jgi:hypothetical protein
MIRNSKSGAFKIVAGETDAECLVPDQVEYQSP